MGKVGNQWWVHQRGASPVGYGSRRAAWRAAASLRNARVSRYYGARERRSGQHSVSDAPAYARGVLEPLLGVIAVAVIRAARRLRRR